MILRQLSFLLAVWQANLQSAMEYRVTFITQVVGMMLNNAVYFIFWGIFFDRFGEVRGWGLHEMFLLFGIVAASFGLASYLFGNAFTLANVIVSGRLDYYLSLPRPVLIHILASRSVSSGVGDFSYGVLSFLLAGQLTAESLGRFVLGTILAAIIFLSFLVLVQSLAFWLGSGELLGTQAVNAIVTFSLYPISVFEGAGKFLLFTILPAALVGAVPAEFIRAPNWTNLGELVAGAVVLLFLATATFYRGLRRYESGSAIQVQL